MLQLLHIYWAVLQFEIRQDAKGVVIDRSRQCQKCCASVLSLPDEAIDRSCETASMARPSLRQTTQYLPAT